MSEEDKQRLKEHQINCRRSKKNNIIISSVFFLIYIKMESKILSYDKTCIDKNEFHKETNSVNTDEVEIDKIMLFDKTSYGNKGLFKYYIGYIHKGKAFPSPLSIKLPHLTGYTKHFDNNNKYVNLLVNDKKLFKITRKYGIRLKTYPKKN